MTPTELRDLRAQLNLTREAMAERLCISASALYKLETGANNMSKPVSALAKSLAKEPTT